MNPARFVRNPVDYHAANGRVSISKRCNWWQPLPNPPRRGDGVMAEAEDWAAAAQQELRSKLIGNGAIDDSIVARLEAEQVARWFHEEYERLAPNFGYRTRAASAVPWEQVPLENRELMVAVAESVLQRIHEQGGETT